MIYLKAAACILNARQLVARITRSRYRKYQADHCLKNTILNNTTSFKPGNAPVN